MKTAALILVASVAVGAAACLGIVTGRNAAERTPNVSEAPGLPMLSETPAAPRPVTKPNTLNIPRLHLRVHVNRASQLNRGPAWWPVTGRPGGGDTIAIAGHRTTHTHPFYFLDELRPGDVIYVRMHGRAYRYVVRGVRVVIRTNVHIGDAVGYERLLLTACTPRGSAAYRLVVEARRAP